MHSRLSGFAAARLCRCVRDALARHHVLECGEPVQFECPSVGPEPPIRQRRDSLIDVPQHSPDVRPVEQPFGIERKAVQVVCNADEI